MHFTYSENCFQLFIEHKSCYNGRELQFTATVFYICKDGNFRFRLKIGFDFHLEN